MAREQFEVLLSKNTVVKIAELSARESDMADRIIGDDFNALRISKIYAICSVREINGRVVTPSSDRIQFNSLSDILSATEAFTLAEAYGEHFSPITGDDLKNESSDLPQEPSPIS